MKKPMPKRLLKKLEEIVECPECEGQGEVEYQTVNYYFQGISLATECPVCEGEGSLSLLDLFELGMGDTDSLQTYAAEQRR